MLRGKSMRGPALAEREDDPGPITTYDEYLRRYLPDEVQEVTSDPETDPTAAGEEAGRQVVERAMAKLASSVD
jgi:hypothetical protein